MTMGMDASTGMGTGMGMTAELPLTAAPLPRLQPWFGPSFPVGAFSYSHGLEAAFEAGLVTDRESMMEWLEGLLLFGSARNDAILFAETYRRFPDVADVAELAAALSPSMELRAETLNQGSAFLRGVRQGWPDLHAQSIPGRSNAESRDRGPRGDPAPDRHNVASGDADQVIFQNSAEPRKGASPVRGLPGGSAEADGDPVPRCARPGIGEALAGEIALPVAAGGCCALAQIPLNLAKDLVRPVNTLNRKSI